MLAERPLLEVDHVRVRFGGRRAIPLVRGARPAKVAVDDVSFTVAPGETVGIVGESGSGKSTVARAVTRLGPITAGHVRFDGRDVGTLTGPELRRERRHFQMIFQNPSVSLNPRMTALQAVMEPLLVHRIASDTRSARTTASSLLERCGLPSASWTRRPDALSGGQQQRVAISRALAVQPRLIVADEPTSALDVSAQARVVNLMSELRSDLGVAFLFIGHDLAVVRHVSHRIIVMNAGRVVETGPSDEVCDHPSDPYTRRLLAASPSLDPAVERQRRLDRAADRG